MTMKKLDHFDFVIDYELQSELEKRAIEELAQEEYESDIIKEILDEESKEL